MEKDIIILAIDTSCDETSAAVIKNGRQVLSNIISSQIETHTAFGGVVPEIASRKHMENIDVVVEAALAEAKVGFKEIDAISATYGPGLVGALLTGLLFAKAMAYALNKPFIGVNHIEGHICSNYLETDWEPPFICLVVSGGHTNLIKVKDYGQYEILGETRDDAAGEAYDKVARVLGLQYPGGPRLDRLAQKGNESAIWFPRASIAENEYDFSFSGVKSAVLNYINKCEMTGQEIVKEDIAAGFQRAVVDVLVQKTVNALNKTGLNKAALAGGVACNSEIRKSLRTECAKNDIMLNIPKPVFCTDNGAMIGSAAYYKYLRGESSALDLNASPSEKL